MSLLCSADQIREGITLCRHLSPHSSCKHVSFSSQVNHPISSRKQLHDSLTTPTPANVADDMWNVDTSLHHLSTLPATILIYDAESLSRAPSEPPFPFIRRHLPPAQSEEMMRISTSKTCMSPWLLWLMCDISRAWRRDLPKPTPSITLAPTPPTKEMDAPGTAQRGLAN